MCVLIVLTTESQQRGTLPSTQPDLFENENFQGKDTMWNICSYIMAASSIGNQLVQTEGDD